jgi:hypothetical protein
MGSPQLAEAYCDRVYDKVLRERVAASATGSRGLESFLPGHADPGDYDIYLKLVQVPCHTSVLSGGVMSHE